MASKKRMNIVYGEKYGDVNDPKTSWKNVGTLFIDEENGRMSIKLDMVPTGNFNGWLSVFEPRPRDGAGDVSTPAQSSSPASSAEPQVEQQINLDDIPF